MDHPLSDGVHVVDTDFLSHTLSVHIRSNPEKEEEVDFGRSLIRN